MLRGKIRVGLVCVIGLFSSIPCCYAQEHIAVSIHNFKPAIVEYADYSNWSVDITNFADTAIYLPTETIVNNACTVVYDLGIEVVKVDSDKIVSMDDCWRLSSRFNYFLNNAKQALQPGKKYTYPFNLVESCLYEAGHYRVRVVVDFSFLNAIGKIASNWVDVFVPKGHIEPKGFFQL